MQAEGFAQAALDSIADHRFTDGSRDGEPDARAEFRVCLAGIDLARLAEGGKQWTGDAESVIIDMPEVGGAENPG